MRKLILTTGADDDLIEGCRKLIEAADLITPDDVLDFFENPSSYAHNLKMLGVRTNVNE